MKRFAILCVVLVLCIGSMKSQVITITFESALNGALTPLDSILVMNLTQGGDTTIYFPDNELVLGTTAISEAGSAGLAMQGLPNPFAGSTLVVLEANGGMALLALHDVAGRELVSLATNLSVGVHRLRVSCARPGVHLLTVVQGGVRHTMRLMATEGAGVDGLSLLSQEQRVRAKSDRSFFTWTPSDELRYIGYATDADIVHSAAIDEVPVVTATRTFELFAGLACPESPTVTDIDGNMYRNVQIGGQCWMAENLRTARYRNGIEIPYVYVNTIWTSTSNGAWCSYGDDAIYGKLYNWYAAANPNICPQGWHVATEVEWQQLELALGMPVDEVLNTAYRGEGQNIGGKLQATSLWMVPNTSATNASGFSGLPGGYRNFSDGLFFGLGGYGYWWTASETIPAFAWHRFLYGSNTGVYRNDWYKRNGMCIRCVRD